MNKWHVGVNLTKRREDFVDQVRPLIAAGAEVIIHAGRLPMLLFARECPFLVDRALVLNASQSW